MAKPSTAVVNVQVQATSTPISALEDSQILSTGDVGRIIGRTPKTVRRMIARGDLPALKSGDRYIITKAMMSDWLHGRPVENPNITALRSIRETLMEGL